MRNNIYDAVEAQVQYWLQHDFYSLLMLLGFSAIIGFILSVIMEIIEFHNMKRK